MAEATRQDVRLFSAASIPADHAMADRMREAAAWVERFVSQPHPELGRPGAICPFTKSSLAKQLCWVGVATDSHADAESIIELMSGMAEQFLELPGEDSDAIFKTVLVLLPCISDYTVIDDAHLALKAAYVAKGLMIGQFYPGCDVGGRWNAAFHPLDAPMPMLVIRHMIASDFPFLIGSPQWVDHYIRRFAPSLPCSVRTAIAQRFEDSNAARP